MKDELKPCPFCGGKEHQVGYLGQPAVEFYVKCGGCGARGPALPSATATGGTFNAQTITAWNNRA